MSKDVRIEIIYYKTPADVSLEFGLHGDYPLRMLSENCDNRNTFFQYLKRAVSRSEIIIVIGGYSSKDKIPQFISRAIGKKSYIPDYKSEGIDADDNYPIPANSEILTTKFSNRFGGFLLECGPQTIISLTDDKFTRLSIVREFIVNYISEHHQVFNSTPSAIVIKEPKAEEISINSFKEEDSETENSQTKIAVSEQFDDYSLSEPIPDSETQQEPLPEEDFESIIVNETELSQEDIADAESTEVFEDAEQSTDDQVSSQAMDSENKSNLLDDIGYVDKIPVTELEHKQRSRRRKIRILCLILSLLAVIGSIAGALIIEARNTSASATDYYSFLSENYISSSGEQSEAFEELLKINPNFLAWLKFEDGKINHPILTVKENSDIENYMDRLPNGVTDQRGTLVTLADGCIVNNPYNTVVYGNAESGGLLDTFSLFSPSFKGRYITTADSQYSANWQIFASFTANEAGSFDYTQTVFSSNEEYLSFLNKLLDLSPSTEYEFSGIEKTLTFVGIKGNERIITVAVLRSMLILSVPEYQPDESSSSPDVSSEIASSANSSSTESEPEEKVEDHETDDFLGQTSDIVLPAPPPIPSTPSDSSGSTSSEVTSSRPPVSSLVSSAVSSVISSDVLPSLGGTSSSVNSSQNTSTQTSSTATSQPTSSNTATSSVDSSIASSTASQPSQPKPTIDPMYTWDVYLACKSNKTGEVIMGDAVTIIAMIIEIEMSPTIDPPEALIAQAVVKYNWMLNNGGVCTVGEDGTTIIPPSKPPTNAIDTNPTPQALKYAREAKGMLLLYGNTVAKTYCHSYSAGYTAAYHNIWGGGNYPYLQGVECPVDSTNSKFETVTKYSSETIKTLIKNKLNVDVSSMPKTDWLKPVKYDNNNTYCVTISIGGVEQRGTYLRNTLLTGTGISTIRSSAYTIEYNEENDEFIVTTRGYGHGVGLSQYGAKQYAKQGWNCEQILKHFFPGTTLVKY